MPKANNLLNLRLAELSLVDNPANKGARVTIFKRDTAGSTGPHHQEQSMEELKKRVAELESSVADLTTKLAAANAAVGTANTAKAEADAKVVTLTAENDGLKKAAEVAKNDESFTGEGGIVVKKSDVGETTYKLLKSQHEKLELVDFTKRAETDLGNLTGETVMKAKVIKAIDGIADEAVRKAAHEMLKGANAAMKKNMTTIGADGENQILKAADALDVAVKKYQADNKIGTYAEAYTKFLETDDGRALYRKHDDEHRRSESRAA